MKKLSAVIGVVLLAGLAPPAEAQNLYGANPFPGGPIPIPLPGPVNNVCTPGTELFHTITVPDAGLVADLNVHLNLTHTWYGDLDITVTSPSGTVAFVKDGLPDDSSDLGGTYILNDEAAGSWDAAAAAVGGAVVIPPGSYTVDVPLSVFDGESITGVWTITICDTFAGDLGTLNGAVLAITKLSPGFSEDFEGGGLGAYVETNGAGAATPTLWHGEALCTVGTPIPAAMGTNAASYNQGDIGTYTYNTGAANSGAIQSPTMPLLPGLSAILTFDYLRETEPGAAFDQCFVESRVAAGVYATDAQITGLSVCAVTSVSLALGAVGASIQHQFRFNSGDGVLNDFQGWTVDNVDVKGVAGGVGLLLSENFEGGSLGAYRETDSAGTSAPTLWHAESQCAAGTPIPASMGSFAASYNQGNIGTYTYNTGAANAGAIQSPLSPLPSGSTAVLEFDYLKETEGGGTGTFDQCFVESRAAGGAYATDAQITGNSVCTSTTVCVTLGASAATIQHRFRFNSVDGVGNDHQGWSVDNISLVASPGGFVSPFISGCGPITIASAGSPDLGATFSVSLGGLSGGGIPVMWIGFLFTSIPLCPAGCLQGTTLDIMFPGTSMISGMIPCDPALIGGVFSIQGADIFGAGGCLPGAPFAVPFNVSNTLDIVIG